MEGIICSVDLNEEAVVCCACTFPLPSLCEACRGKHCAGTGFHCLLPLSALQVIQSQRQLMQLQPRLVQLSKTCKEAYALLPEIDRCAELIESVYQELLHLAGELKVEYQEKLSMLKQGYLKAVNKAIQETTQHSFEGQNYVPEDPLARLMWEDDPNRSSSLVKFEASARCVRSHLNLAFQVAFGTSLPGLEHLNVGTSTTPIQALGGESYNLQKQSSGSIKTLKAYIEMMSNIPIGFEKFNCEVCLVYDEMSLSECSLEKASHLELTNSSFPIKIRLNSRAIILSVKDTDTLASVIIRLKDMVRIKPEEWLLVISDKVVREYNNTIGHYNVSKDSSIKLVLLMQVRLPSSRPRPSVMIVGDTCVGKTCIMSQMSHGIFPKQCTITVGIDFINAELDVQGNRRSLQIWDSCGVKAFKQTRISFFYGHYAIILMYDLSGRCRGQSLESWLEEIRDNSDPEVIIYLVGNKTDLVQGHQGPYEMTTEQLCQKHRLQGFADLSAMNTADVKKVFNQVAELVYNRIKVEDLNQLKEVRKSVPMAQEIEQSKDGKKSAPMVKRSIFKKLADRFSHKAKKDQNKEEKQTILQARRPT